MPRSVYQSMRSSIQYWCHSSSVPGSTKNSISICSNSRVRKMKLPGVISLRKLLPIWPMPNGGFMRGVVQHVGEVDEDALRGLRAQVVQALLVLHRAEVGLEQAVEHRAARSTAPLVPQFGQVMSARPFSGSRPCFSSYASMQVVCAVPLVAVQALDERVGERRRRGRRPPRPGGAGSPSESRPTTSSRLVTIGATTGA